MTKIIIIFLRQETFTSEFLLKNSNAAENYSVITEMVSLRGVNKVHATPTRLVFGLFNKHPRLSHRGVPPPPGGGN